MVAVSKNRIQELTRAELEIMQVLWRIGAGVVRDILEELVAPKPAYNTVSTIVRILEKKGFVGHKAYGKTPRVLPARHEGRLCPPLYGSGVEQLLRRLGEPAGFLLFGAQGHIGGGD